MNNTFITIVLVFSLFLFVVFLTNTITIYAQQVPQTQAQSPSSSTTSPPKPHAVKIISPTKGQQIPVGKQLITCIICIPAQFSKFLCCHLLCLSWR